jgi:hypothetical protein
MGINAGALISYNSQLQDFLGQKTNLGDRITSGQGSHVSAFTALQGELAGYSGRALENASAFVGAENFLVEAQFEQIDYEGTLFDAVLQETDATELKADADETVVVASAAEDEADIGHTEAETLEGLAEVEVGVADVAVGQANQRVDTATSEERSLLQQIQAEKNKSVLQKIGSFFSNLLGLEKKHDAAVRNTISEVVGQENAEKHMADMKNAHENAQGVTDTAKGVLETRKGEHGEAVNLADAAQIILDAKTGAREISEQELGHVGSRAS